MFRKLIKPTETSDQKTERRWLKSVIAASSEPLPAFPWMRSAKVQQAPRSEIEVLISESHRRTTPLFRRNGPATGLAAR